jgi:hypothetical protein
VFNKLLQHPIVQATLAWLRAHPREGGVLAAILAVLIGPFLLKPADTTTPRHWDRRLVIVTPHPGLIRDEFGHAFAAHWKAKTGETLYIDWHNHSRDYPVDVWMSYGGGYTDLAVGATWDEPIGHCRTPFVGDEYADISTACSSFRFLIHCR